jgi:hypothetical protein
LGVLGGNVGRNLTFVALLGVYVFALGISTQDKMQRVGRPDVGWVADLNGTFSPSRRDSSEMGLRWGGRALALNGVPVDPRDFERQSLELVAKEPGSANTIRFERWGQIRELTIPVADWTWRDALFMHGLIDLLALLFVATALTSFALRPWEATSWAILSLASVTGGVLTVSLLPEGASRLEGMYLSSLAGLLPFAILHAGLAYPVVHPLFLRRSTILVL